MYRYGYRTDIDVYILSHFGKHVAGLDPNGQQMSGQQEEFKDFKEGLQARITKSGQVMGTKTKD